MDKVSIAWAAGLFEGEGCFNFYRPVRGGRQVQARLGMSDRDVVERFAAVVGVGTVHKPQQRRPGEKPMHNWSVYGFEGVQAVSAMLWPWLGERRRAKVREVLHAGRTVQRKGDRPYCPAGHPYSGDNLMEEPIERNGRAFVARRCRECRRAQARERKRRTLGISADRYRV